MFKNITLKNYRTHKLTTIQLKPVTLFIGKNNSGKTNFLAGIQHFANLIRQSRPGLCHTPKPPALFADRYRFAKDDEPMGFAVKWENPRGEIAYEMELYPSENFKHHTGCREKIKIQVLGAETPRIVRSGYECPSDEVGLRGQIQSKSGEKDTEQKLCEAFFSDLENTFSYHFQPTALQGVAQTSSPTPLDDTVDIPAALGYDGRNLREVLRYVKANKKEVFARFVTLMQRFERTFQGIDASRPELMWEFGFPRSDELLGEFTHERVSAGLLKVAAIALLASLERRPALLLVEEIEGSINPGRIQDFMFRLWQTTAPNAAGYRTQFILTSHSPSVLCEFNEHLDHVYTFALVKRDLESEVKNMNDELNRLRGDTSWTIVAENGMRLIQIPQYEIPTLWHSGTIG